MKNHSEIDHFHVIAKCTYLNNQRLYYIAVILELVFSSYVDNGSKRYFNLQ